MWLNLFANTPQLAQCVNAQSPVVEAHVLLWERAAVPRERAGKSVRIVVVNDYGSAGHVAKITTLFRQSTCVDSGSMGRLFGQDKTHRQKERKGPEEAEFVEFC